MGRLHSWVLVLLTIAALTAPARQAAAQSAGDPLGFGQGYVVNWNRTYGTVHLVAWGYHTSGYGGDPQHLETAAQAVFRNDLLQSYGIGGTRFFGVADQYYGYDWADSSLGGIGNPGGLLGGAWRDDHIADPNIPGDLGLPPLDNMTATYPQIEAVVNRAFANHGLVDYDDMVVVLLPPNVYPPIAACGEHNVSPNSFIYAWIAYPGVESCGFSQTEAMIVHEITEAATDTDGGSGWRNRGGEIGDNCEGNVFTVQTQPSTSSPSQVGAQQMVSNESVAAGGSGCVYGRSRVADAFGLGTDNSLFQTPFDADKSVTPLGNFSWGAPSMPTGVTLTGSPGATSWGDGRLDVFVRDTTGKMYHALTNDNDSTSWESLPSTGVFTQSPDAVTWGAGNIQVYGVQGTNIVKNTKDGTGAWSGWTMVARPSGVNPVSKVTVTSWGASNFDGTFPTTNRTVVAAFRGSDSKVWIGNAANGGAFTWKGFTAPASLKGDLDISAWAPPRLDLFVLDTSGNFWDMASNDGGKTIAPGVRWGHPSAGPFQVGAGVVGLGDGRLLVVGRVGGNGGSGFVQLFNWQAGSWVTWSGAFNSGLDIASR